MLGNWWCGAGGGISHWFYALGWDWASYDGVFFRPFGAGSYCGLLRAYAPGLHSFAALRLGFGGSDFKSPPKPKPGLDGAPSGFVDDAIIRRGDILPPSARPTSMANILAVAGVNSKYKAPGSEPAGFWAGLWHGMIAPITFLVSLFNNGVSIYETNNNGRWYEFGFLLAMGGQAGGTAVCSTAIK